MDALGGKNYPRRWFSSLDVIIDSLHKYLDGELSDVEHVCCMAHVRAIFLKALILGKDENTRFFLARTNELYEMEAFYKKKNNPSDRMKEERRKARTIELITEI